MSHGRDWRLTERARTRSPLKTPCERENRAAPINVEEQALETGQAFPPAEKTGGRSSVDVSFKKTLVVEAFSRRLAEALQASHSS